jgi:hypothetical protein
MLLDNANIILEDINKECQEVILETYNVLLNERVYGKVPALKNVESILGQIKEDISKNNIRYGYKEEYKQEFTDIETILAKLFNVETLEIFIKDDYEYNAMTLPLAFASPKFLEDYKLIENENGVSFKNAKRKHIFILMNSGLFTSNIVTVEDLMSLILHEVGHNFFLVKQQIEFSTPFLRLILIFKSISDLFKHRKEDDTLSLRYLLNT